MIVTCASCLTKFSLDESRLPVKGAKVRCSKCQHVFFVVPPTESKTEEPEEDFESFLKSQEGLEEFGQRKVEGPAFEREKREEARPTEEEGIGFPEEEEALFREEPFGERVAEMPSHEAKTEERAEAKPVRTKRPMRAEKRGLPAPLLIAIIAVLLVLGGFFVLTELGSERSIRAYLEYPIQKGRALFEEVLGVKDAGLVVGDLNRYDERMGKFLLSVIEGKVKNQSGSARKYIKIRVEVFDQNKRRIVEKEAICGLNIGLDGLRRLPPAFFEGEMLIQPEQPKEMIVLAGKEAPFMVVFKDLASQAKEFRVRISEAPNL